MKKVLLRWVMCTMVSLGVMVSFSHADTTYRAYTPYTPIVVADATTETAPTPTESTPATATPPATTEAAPAATTAPATTVAAPAATTAPATTDAAPAATTAPATTDAAPAATTAPATTEAAPAATTAPATTEATPATTSTTPTTAATNPKQSANGSEKVSEGRTVAGRVVWVKGTFRASKPGSTEKRALKTASNIYLNDTLTTDASSEAQIVFTDNTNMTFRPDTEMYINEYNYSAHPKNNAEKKSAGKYVMDLVTGGFRTLTGLIAKENPNDYQVTTPVATIGVRGTEFSVVYKEGSGLYIKRYQGKPCATNKGSGTGQSADSKTDVKNSKQKEVCFNAKDQYGYVQNGDTAPVVLAKQPEVFVTDVEIVPVNYTNVGELIGPNTGIGGSFCIQ